MVYLLDTIDEHTVEYSYANIVNIEINNPVVISFDTNPIFRFIKFYDSYNDISNLDTRLPTLYVGYKKAKEVFGVNVLTQKFESLAWWCPSPEEDSMRFLKGFKEFLSEIALALVKDLQVFRTDPIFGPAINSIELLQLLNKDELLVSYLRNGAFHLYTSGDKVIILDAVLYQTYGVDVKRLKIYLKENSRHYYDDENNAIYHFFTNSFEYDPAKVCKYIPYLIWVKARVQGDIATNSATKLVDKQILDSIT